MKQILCSATSQPSPSSYREVSSFRGSNIRYLKGGIHKIQQFLKFSRFKVWNWFPMSINILTHFSPMFHFYTPESIIKTKVFWRFQGGYKNETLGKMGWEKIRQLLKFLFVVQGEDFRKLDAGVAVSNLFHCCRKTLRTVHII